MHVYVDDEPIGEVSRMNLAPGDVLLVRCKQLLTARDAAEIRGQVKLRFPDNEVLVVSDDIEVTVAGEELRPV